MSYQVHNFQPGDVLLASQLNEMDNQIALNESSSTLKSSIANEFSTSSTYAVGDYVIYEGQLYQCTTAVATAGSWNSSNWTQAVLGNDVSDLKSAIENIEAIPRSVKMAMDTLFSKSAYADDDAASSYATFHAWATANPVTSITAVFAQGSTTIYDTDSLDTLKQYLTVTATYSDSTTATVTDYTLSGELTVGTSTITVSYGSKTTTVDVTVTHSETPGENLVDFSTGFGSQAVNKTTVSYSNGALTCVCTAAPAYAGVSYWFKQAHLQQFLTDGKRYRLHFSVETISGNGSHIMPSFFTADNSRANPEKTGFTTWIENNGVFDGTWVQQSDVGNIFFFLSNDSASSNTYTVVFRDMWIKEVV